MNSSEDKEILERLIVTEQRSRSNTHRLDDIHSDISKINVMETKIDENNKDIEQLKKDSSVMYRLITNQEVMNHNISNLVEDHKQQTANTKHQMNAFTNTLEKMNDNLTSLNNAQNNTNSEMQSMRNEIVSTKNHVKEVEELAQSNKARGKFDMLNFFTVDAPKYVGLAILGAILAYYFGIK